MWGRFMCWLGRHDWKRRKRKMNCRRPMRVLLGCERSGKVREAFRARGHDAVSCDLEPADDGSPNHYRGDVFDILGDGWDMLIGHPECTYLANSSNKHLYRGKKRENGVDFDRWRKMVDAADFFRRLLEADIPKVAIENPIMHGHAKHLVGSEQTQLIQPWQHGHKVMKATCLWLRRLPPIIPTNIVGPPPKDPAERKAWAVIHNAPPGPDRKRMRSETFDGIAYAFASQWG